MACYFGSKSRFFAHLNSCAQKQVTVTSTYWAILILMHDVLIQWSKFFLVKLIVTQLVKKLPVLYRTRRFITLF